ncbi:hypothetical protein KIN20_009007, partial [Parelaphostrongylus tenuis]
MDILSNMVRQSTGPLIISLLVTFPSVLGCGVVLPGQASSRTFTVSGFTLPVAMVYSPTANARFPNVATNKGGVQAFVQRLVMQTVFDVLERLARSALLPDAVISSILEQLSLTIRYTPVRCDMMVNPGDMRESS